MAQKKKHCSRRVRNQRRICLGRLWRYCLLIMYGGSYEIATHHVARHNTLIHNILPTVPQFNISQKALGTLPEDANVMPKHVGTTIRN
jgi:hypothetical protein